MVSFGFGHWRLGAFVAGNDAGYAYNTWPKMNEDWVPPEVVEAKSNPKNVFEDTAVVQFEHRMLAYSTLAIAAGTAWKASTLKVLPPIFRVRKEFTDMIDVIVNNW
eukprot:Selendium_serpulae@DN6023_c0_g1_i1.p1